MKHLHSTARLALFMALYFLGFTQCANVVTPAGGPKDETSPELVSAEPPNFSTGFNNMEVTLEFNEFIDVREVFQQVVVSPPLEEQPDFKVKGKRLIMQFQEALKPDRTYTVNFGEAIRDITEGNVLKNFQYVISTGDLIDSLQIDGTVLDAWSLEPIEGVYVMLYPDLTDSVVFRQKPYYFAISDDAGKYTVTNIAEGRYKLFALNDQNFNYLYDLPNEQIGFPDSTITVDTNRFSYPIRLFQEDKGKQSLLSAKCTRYGKVVLIFENALNEGKITSDSLRADQLLTEYTPSRDTLIVWTTAINKDSLNLRIAFDTLVEDQTVRMKKIPPDSTLANKPLSIRSNMILPDQGLEKGSQETGDLIQSWDLNKPIRLVFDSPLEIAQLDSIRLLEDTLNQIVQPDFLFTDSIRRRLEIQFPWKEATRYTLIIPTGCFRDIYGSSNDNLRLLFKTKRKEDYGILRFNLYFKQKKARIFQLMDAKGQLVREYNIPADTLHRLSINYLKEGDYTVKLIEDQNNNGKWDPGNYLNKQQPENVIFFNETPSLRTNWELDFDWYLDAE